MKKKFKKIKAIGKCIFLIKDEMTETPSGIILLEKKGTNLPPFSGTIVAVGNTVEDADYKEGVRVLYHDFAGFEFEHEGQKFYSIREKDVAAIVEKNITIE
jgi:co-chaperonin GroES (HSP10)